jgi:hypothetical protein
MDTGFLDQDKIRATRFAEPLAVYRDYRFRSFKPHDRLYVLRRKSILGGGMMRVSLSYPSEYKAIAEPIAFSLRSRGHKVFLDRDDLPAGQTYDDQIREAINLSDVFVYLITPESVTPGRFTVTELSWARQKWGTADQRVLPVMVKKTDMASVPSYLKSVTILEPAGNVSAEVVAAVGDIVRAPDAGDFVPKLAALGAASGLISGAIAALTPDAIANDSRLSFTISEPFFIVQHMKAAPIYVPLIFSAALAWGIARWTNLRVKRVIVLWSLVTAGWLLAVNIAFQMPTKFGASLSIDPSLMSNMTTEARQAVEAAIANQNSNFNFVALLICSFAAGLVGAVLTTTGLMAGLGGIKRSITSAHFVTVALIGGLAGIALIPANSHIGMFGNTYLPLFVVWQAAVGGVLAYALSQSRA